MNDVAEAMAREIESLRARLAEAEADNARLVAANKARDEFLRGHRYKHSEVDGYIDLCESQMADLKAQLAEAKALLREAHDNNTNVIVQANLASTLTSHPSLSPTHCCVDCGALWRQCDDFSMNLRSPSCCDACNNAPAGPQIRPLYVAPTAADREDGSHG